MALPILDQMVNAINTDDSEALEELLQTTEKLVAQHLTTFIVDGEFKGQSLLHIAADKSRNKCVRTILAKVNPDNRKCMCNLHEENEYGRIPLHTALDGGCRCEECSAKNIDCVTLLLEGGSEVNSRDNEGDTPLFYATEHMMADCASLLLEYGADASLEIVPRKHRKSVRGTPGHGVKVILYKYIAQKIPRALTALLDKGITPSKEDSAILNLDFKVFLPGEKSGILGQKETDVLVCISKAHSAGKELLLTHPMTLSFLHFKWSLVRRFVLFIQFSYFVMTALYTIFVLEAFDFVIPETRTTETPPPEGNYSFIGKLDTGGNGEEKKNQPLITGLACFICLWWTFMVLNEIYEISVGLRIYLTVGLNYAWWVLIICVGVSIPPGFGVEPQLWQLPLSAFAVFLAWSLTLVQTSRFPSLGIYIEMLGKVVMDFAIFLVTFAALLVGFALAFHVLFPKDQMFSNVATAFVRVILMMIGETNYEGLFEEVVDPDLDILGLEYTIPAHIIFVGFIFVITIVLMNLLLGLAVSDIQELRKVATVLRVKRQIEQIQLFESLILGIGKFFPDSFSNRGMEYFSIMKILENYDLESPTSLLICPTDPEDKTLPKSLKERFIDHVLDQPCINKPDVGGGIRSLPPLYQYRHPINTATPSVPPPSIPPHRQYHHHPINTANPGNGRLEDKMNQMQETLLAIQEQLASLAQK